MTTPFDMPSEAFAPMYHDKVVVRGGVASAPVEITLPACVFEGGFDNPVDDEAIATERRTLTILVPKGKWRFAEPPKTGMTLEIEGVTYTIQEVAPVLGDWQMTARERSSAR